MAEIYTYEDESGDGITIESVEPVRMDSNDIVCVTFSGIGRPAEQVMIPIDEVRRLAIRLIEHLTTVGRW